MFLKKKKKNAESSAIVISAWDGFSNRVFGFSKSTHPTESIYIIDSRKAPTECELCSM